jgi:hypothetical protein
MAVRVVIFEKKVDGFCFLIKRDVKHTATRRLVRIVKKLKYLIMVSGIDAVLFITIR